MHLTKQACKATVKESQKPEPFTEGRVQGGKVGKKMRGQMELQSENLD
uniref:Uncharacterized protein n=1 Tax=Rhizophora mucronata TaxID=61149 RepID=A0A2P2JDH3_RHIMU